MTKKEIIWREILHRTLEYRSVLMTQRQLAEKYDFSLSTVFNALKAPRRTGVVEVKGRGLAVADIEKFLYLWASFRNISKDILYQTSVNSTVKEIEGLMPASVVFGAFSAYCLRYQDTPADYDAVYVYVAPGKLEEIGKRFPPVKGYSNLVVLKADPYLNQFGQVTPDVQTFVDLWNLPQWYAKDFLTALKQKILD